MIHTESAPPASLEKIVDPALKSFARSADGAARQSVIVELAAPFSVAARQVGEVPRRDQVAKHGRLVKKKKAAPALTPHAELMDRLEGQIGERVSRRFVRLDAAEAFVIEVTPEQLRALCQMSLVGSVRPNRVHRI